MVVVVVVVLVVVVMMMMMTTTTTMVVVVVVMMMKGEDNDEEEALRNKRAEMRRSDPLNAKVSVSVGHPATRARMAATAVCSAQRGPERNPGRRRSNRNRLNKFPAHVPPATSSRLIQFTETVS